MMNERTACESIGRAAAQGDRARRRAAGLRLAARMAPIAAAFLFAASLLATLVGARQVVRIGAPIAIVVGAAVVWFRVRPARQMSDAIVADLDRTANLGGALRSGHWFAIHHADIDADNPNRPWIGFHLTQAASAAEHANWAAVYPQLHAGRAWLMSVVFGLASIAVLWWPASPLAKRTFSPTTATQASTGPSTSLPAALVPQLVEGMRAMKAGKVPSPSALTAIGQALEIAKTDRLVGKEIQALFAHAGDADPLGELRDASDPEITADELGREYELAALDWAYKDAIARAAIDPQTMPQSGKARAAAQSSTDGKAGERNADELGGGNQGAPELADVRGQAPDFSTLLFGRQQASGEGTAGAPPQTTARAAALSAALRQEIIHARSGVDGPNLEGATLRRATNGTNGSSALVVSADPRVTYNKSHAIFPPVVPEARRSLVRSFFLRAADSGPSVKHP
jgi:hypothetical protein